MSKKCKHTYYDDTHGSMWCIKCNKPYENKETNNMKKLTRAQQEVLELLRGDVNAHIVKGFYYHTSRVITCNGNKYFTMATFNALLRLNIIKPTDNKDIYVLSEKE